MREHREIDSVVSRILGGAVCSVVNQDREIEDVPWREEDKSGIKAIPWQVLITLQKQLTYVHREQTQEERPHPLGQPICGSSVGRRESRT